MVRVAAKAVIVRDDKLLVIACRDSDGEFYILPGGGPEKFETLADALRRECREEIEADVEVGELVFVREYMVRRSDIARDFHQVEVIFACRVPDDYVPANGVIPDPSQHGVTWVPLDELERVRLYPAAIKPMLAARTLQARYLGAVD